MSVYHVCVNVTAAMRYSDDMLADLFRVSEDKVSEVRTRLTIAHMQQHLFMAIAEDCDNFNPSKGCGGHLSFEIKGSRL